MFIDFRNAMRIRTRMATARPASGSSCSAWALVPNVQIGSGYVVSARSRISCLNILLQENRRVVEIREKIKTFLASQGMIKGHSGSGPRTADQEQTFLALSDDYCSSSDSPPTPTLSLSPSDELHSFHHTSHVRSHSPPWSTALPPINPHYGGQPGESNTFIFPTFLQSNLDVCRIDLAPAHTLLRPSSPYAHNESYGPYNSYSHTSSSNSLVSQALCKNPYRY